MLGRAPRNWWDASPTVSVMGCDKHWLRPPPLYGTVSTVAACTVFATACAHWPKPCAPCKWADNSIQGGAGILARRRAVVSLVIARTTRHRHRHRHRQPCLHHHQPDVQIASRKGDSSSTANPLCRQHPLSWGLYLCTRTKSTNSLHLHLLVQPVGSGVTYLPPPC